MDVSVDFKCLANGPFPHEGGRRELWDRIQAIDLTVIQSELAGTIQNGAYWDEAKACRAVSEYRLFLYVAAVEGASVAVVPTRDIDCVWHYCVLDTAKYFLDCWQTFGFFLHHVPMYKKTSSLADGRKLSWSFRETQQLFKKHFSYIPDLLASPVANCEADGDSAGCSRRTEVVSYGSVSGAQDTA